MARASVLFLSGAVLGAAALVACSVGNDCDFGLCAEYKSTDGGIVVDAHPVPADCDISLSPSVAPSCVVDDVGVFVSPNGQFGAAGTKASPVRSINEGLQKAASGGLSRVYICDGQYAESLELSAGIGIYGGFDCTWSYTAVKPQITSPSGPALTVRSLPAPVVLEDLALKSSSSAAVPGDSAIGALLLEATVTLRRVSVVVGAGQPGRKGGSQSNYAKAASSGALSSGANGGAKTVCTCLDGTTSTGGHGADGTGASFSSGSSMPMVGSPNAGTSMEMSCTAGTTGTDGAAVSSNAALAASAGTVTASGWDISKVGDPAPNGNPGQGGGGGGASTMTGIAGGGGGCGGCGGAGAKAGANGGASIGVLAFKSQVFVEASAITTAIGGKGGAGGDGQPGQRGGDPSTGSLCNGGTGGSGAGGDGGPGGVGGDSIAIASGGGPAPTVSPDTTLTTANGGPGGDGGGAGAGSGTPGNAGNPGVAGRSLKLLQ